MARALLPHTLHANCRRPVCFSNELLLRKLAWSRSLTLQIAKDYEISLDDVVNANPQLADPNVVMAGSIIRLPCKPQNRCTAGARVQVHARP